MRRFARTPSCSRAPRATAAARDFSHYLREPAARELIGPSATTCPEPWTFARRPRVHLADAAPGRRHHLLLLLIGTPIAWWLARTRSRWKGAVGALVALPLVLPPTVLGFYLLVHGPARAGGRS